MSADGAWRFSMTRDNNSPCLCLDCQVIATTDDGWLILAHCPRHQEVYSRTRYPEPTAEERQALARFLLRPIDGEHDEPAPEPPRPTYTEAQLRRRPKYRHGRGADAR